MSLLDMYIKLKGRVRMTDSVKAPLTAPKGLTANQLKLIAIVAMTIDHIAALFVADESPLSIIMHCIGRITGPTMFFLAAMGVQYARNINRYMARLGIFALVSYIPFIFAFNGGILSPTRETVFQFNVIYTILVGVAAIRIRRSGLSGVVKALLIVLMYALSTFGDWGTLCISIMLVFDIFHGDFKKQFWGYLAVIFIQGGLLNAITHPLFYLKWGELADFSYYWMYISELGMLIPAFLLSRYNGQKGKGGSFAKWGFYIFYPAHLLVLGFLAYHVFV